MSEIFQTRLPYDPFVPRPLPGIAPIEAREWLIRDESYAAQMAYRRQLIAQKRAQVVALSPDALPAAQELLDQVVLHLLQDHQGFERCNRGLRCPDGAEIALDQDDPLGSLGQITQEDFCLLQKSDTGDEHVMTGAVLCFPASWLLAEKFMKPLIGIHQPVDEYDPQIARRVQRLFDGIQVGRPLWRFNALWYDQADLHQPRSAAEPRALSQANSGPYLRSERQTLYRLPQTRAVVFGIHSYLLRREDVRAVST